MKKKILIIEDDKRIAAALAIRLSAAYEVLTAANGFQGLKSAVVHKPALLKTQQGQVGPGRGTGRVD